MDVVSPIVVHLLAAVAIFLGLGAFSLFVLFPIAMLYVGPVNLPDGSPPDCPQPKTPEL